MKKMIIMTVIFAIAMLLSPMAMAAEITLTETTAGDTTVGDTTAKIILGISSGIGQGGMDGDEINEYDYFYVNTYVDLPMDQWMPRLSWRIETSYNWFAEDSGTQWDSSTSGFSEKFQTVRLTAGPGIYGNFKIPGVNNEGWYYNTLMAGVDFIGAEGYSPATVIKDDFGIGMGSFFNILNINVRLGDEYYESAFLRDQFYFRLNDWLSFGPQVTYVWFNQDPDGDGDLTLVYEPAFGGQIRLSENSDDPRWSITTGATDGDFVGTSWHADFWIRF